MIQRRARAHDFDPIMSYCRRCGMAMDTVVDAGEFECAASGNVVAISHVVRGRRLGALIGEQYGE